jgi:hypothetical protein
MFKVGKRVRIVSNTTSFSGRTGYIHRVDDSDPRWPYYVHMDELDEQCWFQPLEVELLPDVDDTLKLLKRYFEQAVVAKDHNSVDILKNILQELNVSYEIKQIVEWK